MKTKSTPKFLGLLALVNAGLPGCGIDLNRMVAEPQTYSLDGVKWISPAVVDGRYPQTMLQSGYTISPQGRLLMRFEDLSTKVGQISLGDGRKVEVSISLNPGEDATAAKTSLSLCPVTKNWMMLATWSHAFPMGTTGAWVTDGGDYNGSGCVSGVESVRAAGTTLSDRPTSIPAHLKFDVTNWIVNDVRGRGLNYGLILLSTNGGAVHIRGDQDSAYSPRISWIKTL